MKEIRAFLKYAKIKNLDSTGANSLQEIGPDLPPWEKKQDVTGKNLGLEAGQPQFCSIILGKLFQPR